MNLEDFKEHCSSLIGVTEDYPFDENIIAYKVMDQIFAMADADDFGRINLKCDPVKAATLRTLYEEVQPGFHMNKRHWNTVDPQGTLDDEIIEEWIKDSYKLVIESLPRKKQRELKKLKKKKADN